MIDRKLTVVLLTLLFCWSSSLAQNTCTIRGQVIGRPRGTVYLYESRVLNQAAKLVDSVCLKSSFFSFQRELKEPAGYILALSNAPGQFYFIWDTNVVISLRSDDLNQSLVEESPVNEALKSFSDTVTMIYDKRLNEISQALSQGRAQNDTLRVKQNYQDYYTIRVKQHTSFLAFMQAQNESWAALFLLLTHHKELGRQQTLNLLGAMSKQLQQSQLGSRLKAIINDPAYLILP
ncbi:DUF4369 domain-containing protein [Spirosoma agri]|uniref:DUF4369 domain-containing protein n=1 Tax=Spirosoma agri TaxID=1987381 RepID=A0A6M0IQP4_9BACT|nr:DUF4369 domain-containing protein [Spirosoma agri]NEU70227.1 DUF4369 domain-containing protein [Spirosoma agri]